MTDETVNFVAGWNMPGYLPEMEPAGFETFDEAKRFIIDELKSVEDSTAADGNETAAEEACSLAEDVNLESGPFTTGEVEGYVYWVDVPS